VRVLIDGRPIRIPVSGVARYCLSLANALSNLADTGEISWRPDVLVQSEKGRNPTLVELAASLRQVELTQFGRRRKTQNVAMEFVPFLPSRFGLSKYQLIHETYFANLGTRAKHRKISTIHDVIPIDFPEYFNRSNRFFTARNFRRQSTDVDAIIAVSQFTKERILQLSNFPADKIQVIGCGVDADLVHTAMSAVWPINGRLAKGKRFVLYVGNVEPRKNISALIDACANLPSHHDDVMLVVAGRMNYLENRTIDRGKEILGDRFIYLGAVSESDKWSLLKEAEILVMPSLYEGYGIPIIEAYAARTLALFSRSSSMTELARDDRQMFDPHSIENMVRVIGAALDKPSWIPNVIENAADWVRGNSWQTVAQETLQLYKRVLGQ
jgi:glycosyltransferase involved in cell wall biosynthesis